MAYYAFRQYPIHIALFRPGFAPGVVDNIRGLPVFW